MRMPNTRKKKTKASYKKAKRRSAGSLQRRNANVTSLIGRFTRLTETQLQDLGLAYHAGLFRIERGIGTDEDWGTLAVCLRLGIRFAQTGNGAEYMDALIDAHDAVMSCEERFKKMGKYIFTGDELKRVHVGMTAHDKQMARTSCYTVSKLLVSIGIDLVSEVSSERIAA